MVPEVEVVRLKPANSISALRLELTVLEISCISVPENRNLILLLYSSRPSSISAVIISLSKSVEPVPLSDTVLFVMLVTIWYCPWRQTRIENRRNLHPSLICKLHNR